MRPYTVHFVTSARTLTPNIVLLFIELLRHSIVNINTNATYSLESKIEAWWLFLRGTLAKGDLHLPLHTVQNHWLQGVYHRFLRYDTRTTTHSRPVIRLLLYPAMVDASRGEASDCLPNEY